MPAKAMTYKFLNTFIDDLFAFTIKMPTLHRLATLRDDVIFFVYLYQSWAYKVDYSRVNEFGQGGGDDEQLVEQLVEQQVEQQIKSKSKGAEKPPTAPVADGDADYSNVAEKATGSGKATAKKRKGKA